MLHLTNFDVDAAEIQSQAGLWISIMANKLPINLQGLLRQRTVEGERIEYKAGWNPDPIMRTICAFANDFENLGGGYVVIGQDCDAHGQPVWPPAGLPNNRLDKIQQELLAHCQLIHPPPITRC